MFSAKTFWTRKNFRGEMLPSSLHISVSGSILYTGRLQKNYLITYINGAKDFFGDVL